MTGRGALIKPWIFLECREQRELKPEPQDRVDIYMQLVSHLKEHCGNDAKGRRKAWHFLPWHLDWLHRYRLSAHPDPVFAANIHFKISMNQLPLGNYLLGLKS